MNTEGDDRPALHHAMRIVDEDLGGSMRRIAVRDELTGEWRVRDVDIMDPDVLTHGRVLPVINAAIVELCLELITSREPTEEG
jgi:hypothetical protein